MGWWTSQRIGLGSPHRLPRPDGQGWPNYGTFSCRHGGGRIPRGRSSVSSLLAEDRRHVIRLGCGAFCLFALYQFLITLLGEGAEEGGAAFILGYWALRF